MSIYSLMILLEFTRFALLSASHSVSNSSLVFGMDGVEHEVLSLIRCLPIYRVFYTNQNLEGWIPGPF